MNFYDQARWFTDQQWRQATETAGYWWEQLFSFPDTEPTEDINWLEPLAQWLAVIVLGLVLGIGLFTLGRWAWRKWLKRRSLLNPGEVATTSLPRPIREWLELAQAAQAQGDYAAACRAYYMALLLRLRGAAWLSPTESQTNGEYWKQLDAAWAMGQHPPHLRSPIQVLFQTHTRSYYGGQPTTASTMAQCRDAYFQVEPDITQGPQ